MFTVRIIGNTGQAFSGRLETWRAGQQAGREIGGSVPAEYSEDAERIQVRLDCGADAGPLQVEILKDGHVAATSSASGGNRTITVSAA